MIKVLTTWSGRSKFRTFEGAFLMVALFRRPVFNWQFLAVIIVEVIAAVIVKLVTGLL